MSDTTRGVLPIAASTGRTVEITGLGASTLRRLAKADPSFPKPFRIAGDGDWRWPVPEIVAWLEVRAGRPLAG
jgi:predicted DNA-binding transcriptional regulator AlpA